MVAIFLKNKHIYRKIKEAEFYVLFAVHLGIIVVNKQLDAQFFYMCLYFYSLGTLLVAQLFEALRYKPEGREFDSRWCHCNFSWTYSFRPHYVPGVDSASNINEYQEYFLGGKGGRCLELTTLPPSCVDCLEIWDPQGLFRLGMGLL
jgi:hypothetical protein